MRAPEPPPLSSPLPAEPESLARLLAVLPAPLLEAVMTAALTSSDAPAGGCGFGAGGDAGA